MILWRFSDFTDLLSGTPHSQIHRNLRDEVLRQGRFLMKIYPVMTQNSVNLLSVFLPCLLLLAGLMAAVLIDRYMDRVTRRIMLIIIVLVLSLTAQNYIDYLLTFKISMPSVRIVSSIYGYSVRPVILVLFFYLLEPKRDYRLMWLLAAANACVYLTALFSDICFTIRQDNVFERGPLNFACMIVSLSMLGIFLIMTVSKYFRQGKTRGTINVDVFFPVYIFSIVITGTVLDMFVGNEEQPLSFLTICMVVSCVFSYLWIHRKLVYQHDLTMLEKQRIQMMLSQIRPHFLHNSLAVIAELCDSNPAEAKSATVAFSKYLRGNMDSINEEGAIPFEKELEHTKQFLRLEKMRFEDALRIEYDIKCIDFRIPALTLETLVENAILHGIRENPDGKGTVRIASRRTADAFEVTVTDDGPGFDVDRVMADGNAHVGITNVRGRLEHVCGGTLRIESSPGRGTKAEILIPVSQEA